MKLYQFHIFRLDEEAILRLNKHIRLKKEKEKERQRKRRMDPEFRAKERARDRILKRIARQKCCFTQKVQTLVI